MKKNSPPNSRQKRKLLFDKNVPSDRIVSCGEMYLREGRLNEAAELFSRASHEEGLAQLRALAIEQGDSFLYGVASKGSAEGNSRQAWEALGNKAMELKKYSHAVRAFRKAANEELLKTAEEALKEVISIDEA
jgi:tetratricopeptide (TPR) repeat protein